jgi:purine-nucleoside/S-methyl-5'-thioadenosine phosphorylase / adenosine deaminase
VLSLGSLGGDVHYAFTSRLDGFSASPYDSLNLSDGVGDDSGVVERNRQQVLSRVVVETAAWLRARHGSDVRLVDGPDPVEADGLVSITPGLALGGLSADCTLVVLADARAGVVGVVHCGRLGLVGGVVASAVEAMRESGARTLRAAVGPTVCGNCYEVPAEMAAAVTAVVPAARARSRSGGAGLDIRAGVLAQLAGAGVSAVRQVGGCTVEDPTMFSYRRDGLTGRMGALVWRAA